MIDLKTFIISLNISWIKRMLDYENNNHNGNRKRAG